MIPDVQIHVNGAQGGTVVRHFSEFLEGHRRLRDRGESDDVRATTTLAGFEPDAEPVLREIRNGSLLLVFAFIPPLSSESHPAKTRRFELNMFGTELEKGAGVSVIWDDKEVFVVQRPRGNTVERIRNFLLNYWGAAKR